MGATTSRSPLVIDGAMGEGGGQLLRTSLALSLVTGRAIRVENIRAKRRRPGLLRQHLTAVRAAAAVGGARVQGDALGSSTIRFEPGPIVCGDHSFAIGSAGSSTLVLQTVLWPLLLAAGPSTVRITGGTHNPLAPCFEFMDRSLLSVVRRMGGAVQLELSRHGFVPAGGGRVVAEIQGGARLQPIEWLQRGAPGPRRAVALFSHLPVTVARRELAVVAQGLGWANDELHVAQVDSDGPGNALILEVEHGGHPTVVTSFGAKGRPAEAVAAAAIDELGAFLAADAPVCPHLADQLLIPLALAGGGSFRTSCATEHTRTNARLVERFIDVDIELRGEGERGATGVTVTSRGGAG